MSPAERNRDLGLTLAAAALCAAVCALVGFEPARIAFALPLTLILPGYAIASAAFIEPRIEGSRMAVFAVALSLATLALGALVLNYLGGIHPGTWAALLFVVVLLGVATAARRRRSQPRSPAPARRVRRPGFAALGLAGVGIAAFVAALVLAASNVTADKVVGYTQLWAVPSPAAESSRVEVGVGNQTHDSVPFDLVVRIGDEPRVSREFTVEPGETQVYKFTAGAAAGAGPIPVVATLLLQSDTDNVFRRVKTVLPTAR